MWSPYVVKLEARLRFAGVRYTTDVGSPKSAPRGKIPYIELRDPSSASPLLLSDSGLIIKNLIERGTLPDLNDRLGPAERSHDVALRALLEEKLYFYHVSLIHFFLALVSLGFNTSQSHERWIQNYYTMRDHALWSIPYPVRVLVGMLVYRNITATLHGQGTGRFTADEIAAFRFEIWEGLNALREWILLVSSSNLILW